MRALRWHARGDLRLDEVEIPRPGAGQVLIAVRRVGLCATDVEEYRDGPLDIPVTQPHPLSGRQAPITLGHEVVGNVVESTPDGPAIGSFVVPDVVVGCGTCWWCQRHQQGQCARLAVRGLQDDGGLAPFMLADAMTCVVLPTDMPADVAVFAEPASVAVRAFRKAGDITGAVLCVQGAGTVGALLTQVALASSAADVVVVDPDNDRRQRLAKLGAHVTDIAEAKEIIEQLTGGRGADVVFDCSGALQGPQQAMTLSRRGASVVLVGFGPAQMTVEWLPVVLGERRLIGSAAHIWDEDVRAAVALLARAVITPAIIRSETLSLDEVIPLGFQRLISDPTTPKILIDPTGTTP